MFPARYGTPRQDELSQRGPSLCPAPVCLRPCGDGFRFHVLMENPEFLKDATVSYTPKSH